MNALEYVKQRKRLKCKPIQSPPVEEELHQKLGQLLTLDRSLRTRMEIDKPQLMTTTPEDAGFIF